MDLLTAAGRRGKGAEGGKRTLGKRIENFVEFTTVVLKCLNAFFFLFSSVHIVLLNLTSQNILA